MCHELIVPAQLTIRCSALHGQLLGFELTVMFLSVFQVQAEGAGEEDKPEGLEIPEKQDPVTLWTLHYPREPVEPPTDGPPPGPPWMPIPGGTLGGESQRLRISSRDATAYVGVDAFGEGGAKVLEEMIEASNGNLVKLDHVLQVPPDIGACHYLSSCETCTLPYIQLRSSQPTHPCPI